MRIRFDALFQVRLRHGFYADGRSTADFGVVPSAATEALLAEHGLIFRGLADGWGLYAEAVQQGAQSLLSRPIDEEPLRMHFYLVTRHPHLATITDLDEFHPAREVFYFNNLRLDQASSRLHLGDSVADARVGPPIRLVTGSTLSYRFASAAAAASIEVRDLFGNLLATRAFDLPEPTTEYRLELGDIDALVPGRYLLSDDQGGSETIVYAPDAGDKQVFALVELFNRTDALTPDSTDRVPAENRYLQADEIRHIDDYCIQLEARETSWVYQVVKKYDVGNAIAPAGLTLSGDIPFNKVLEADRAVFTSTASVALGEAPRSLVLNHDGSKVRDLQNPGPATPLRDGASAGSFISEMFVYV